MTEAATVETAEVSTETSEVTGAAPEAAAVGSDEGTSENESRGECAELEEDAPVESESSTGRSFGRSLCGF